MHAAEAAHQRGAGHIDVGIIAARFGVEIFFVISGFVMIASTPDRDVSLPNRFGLAKDFVLRRIIRVAPMYWLCSAAKVVLVLLAPSLALRSSIDWSHVAASFLFIPVVSPWGLVQPILPVGWTLNFEFLFYALFATCIVVTRWRASVATAFLAVVYIAGTTMAEPGSALHFYARTLLFDFAMGMAVARLTQRQLRLPVPLAWFVLAVTLLLSVLNARPTGAWFDLAGFGTIAGLTVWATVSLESRYLCKLKPLELLGNSSYAIYLTHSFFTPGVVIVALKLAVTEPVVLITAATLLPCVLGCMAYKYVEAPITRVLRAKFDTAPHMKARSA